jgi:hypothetical protein
MNAPAHQGSRATGGTIVLRLASEGELFAGPAPATREDAEQRGVGQVSWDAIGATLGESGVERLLRLLHASGNAPGNAAGNTPNHARGVREIVLQIDEASLSATIPSDDARERPVRRLRAWMEATVASRRELVRKQRRMGVRILALSMALFGMLFTLAWFVQQHVQLGQAGPVRMLITDALIIAGWVILWRPLELLIVDPMQPTLERRVLERALRVPMRVEWVRANTACGSS